jgi:hypothetical protein
LRPRGAGWTIRLHEKGGKQHAMPCHHALAEALHTYINAAGIAEDRKGFLFRTARGHNGTVLSGKPMSQPDAWRMIRRRAAAAGIAAEIGCHTFRATGLPLTSRTAARSSMRRKWQRTRARARPSSTTAPRNGSPKTKWKGLGCKPTHWLRHRAGRPGRVRSQLEFQFGAVFSKSVFLQKNRSTLQPGKHVFDGRDSPGLIALGQVDQQPKAIAFLSDNPAVPFQLVIDADDPVSPYLVDEALHGNSLLFFGQDRILD